MLTFYGKIYKDLKYCFIYKEVFHNECSRKSCEAPLTYERKKH